MMAKHTSVTHSLDLLSGLICALIAICRFSQVSIYHLEPPHAQSLSLFPIFFDINQSSTPALQNHDL